MQELVNLQKQTMTSLEIAEVTGKNHKDVMRAIRNMEPAWVKVQGRKFALLSKTYNLPNGGCKKTPYYSLTKTECLYIATKFNDEARAKLVLRWEALETGAATPAYKVPETFSQALKLAYEQQVQIEQMTIERLVLKDDLKVTQRKLKNSRELNAMLEDENAFRKQRNIRDSEEKANLSAMVTARDIKIDGLKQQITEAQPKLDYLSNILANQSDVVITEIAKDYGMSGKAFNKLLYKLGIQYKVNKTWVLYAKHDNKGYTNGNKIEVKTDYFVEQTVWTPRGRIFIYEELKKNGILPLMER